LAVIDPELIKFYRCRDWEEGTSHGAEIAGVVIDDAETAWTSLDTTNITVTIDTTEFKKGSASNRFDIATGAVAGGIAERSFTAMDLSGREKADFWIKSSIAISAGNLAMRFYEAGTLKDTLSIPALAANTWTYCSISFSDPSVLTAIDKIDLEQTVDLGAFSLWIDDIRAIPDQQIVSATDENIFDDVTNTERESGDTEYRKIYIMNHNAEKWSAVKGWISQFTPAANDEISIALGTNFDTQLDAATYTFVQPDSKAHADALSIGDLAQNAYQAIWIKRVVIAGGLGYTGNSFELSFENS